MANNLLQSGRLALALLIAALLAAALAPAFAQGDPPAEPLRDSWKATTGDG